MGKMGKLSANVTVNAPDVWRSCTCNAMTALSNIGGALCYTPLSLADAYY